MDMPPTGDYQYHGLASSNNFVAAYQDYHEYPSYDYCPYYEQTIPGPAFRRRGAPIVYTPDQRLPKAPRRLSEFYTSLKRADTLRNLLHNSNKANIRLNRQRVFY